MSTVRMSRINPEAIKAIKSSPAMVALLHDIADRVTDAANQPGAASGDGFVGGVDENPSGARGYVVTKNQHGMYAEAKDRRLTRALEAGR